MRPNRCIKKMEKGEKQVYAYGTELEQRYGNLRLQKFVVVALGFERVCFKKIVKKEMEIINNEVD